MPLQIDWSKGTSIHRLHGHDTFVREATRANKDSIFMKNVCRDAACVQLQAKENKR